VGDKITAQIELDLTDVQAVEGYTYGGEYDEGPTGSVTQLIVFEAARILVKQMTDGAREDMRNMVVEELRAAVVEEMQRCLDEEIQLTNSYGEPKGEPTSLRDMIVDAGEKWLSELVDSKGNPADDYDRRNNRAKTRLQRYIADAIGPKVKEAFSEQIEGAVRETRAKLDEQITGKVSDAIKDILGFK
jgi:hypothetical protein